MVLFAALLAPAAVAEESDDTNVTVQSGGLAMDGITVSDFTDVTIGNTDQTTQASMESFNVRDFRGSGDGWSVTAQATQFTEAGEEGATLAFGSLTMPAPTVAAVGGTDGSQVPATADPGTIDSDGGASSIATTEGGGDGMGEFEFTVADLSLDIPADVVATTYTSTVTIDLTSGP